MSNNIEIFELPLSEQLKLEMANHVKQAQFEEAVEDYIEAINSMIFAITHEAEKFDIEQFDVWNYIKKRISNG